MNRRSPGWYVSVTVAFIVLAIIARVAVGCRGLFLGEELLQAAYVGDVPRMQAAIRSGADVNFRFETGSTPLRAATANSHYESVLFLLERGADPTIADEYGVLPIDVSKDERITAALRIAMASR